MVEATSFVSPKWVPQMRDGLEVMKRIHRKEGVSYPVLTPNEQGLERAVAAGAEEVAIFASASESFSKKNINSTIKQSLERYEPLAHKAKEIGVKVRGYVRFVSLMLFCFLPKRIFFFVPSCVVGCPYEGPVNPENVLFVAKALRDMGCYEISLGDTIGVGTPGSVSRMLQTVSREIPMEFLAAHFHDTYSQALTNILVAMQMGITTIDSSVAGLGGCPYAKGATGNVATEEVVYMLNGMGIKHGCDLDELIKVGNWISFHLGRTSRSKVAVAITRKREETLPFLSLEI